MTPRDDTAVRIAIISRESPGSVDAIRDHSEKLADALRAAGHLVDLHLRTPAGLWKSETTRRRLSCGLRSYDLAVVQYNPFLYGRRGFAPWLPVELWRVRATRRRPRIALLVHEPFVPIKGWRWTLMGLWQRAQLVAVRAAADVVFVSIEVWTKRLKQWSPTRATHHLPVGSNFPDQRSVRDETRRELRVNPEELVIATVDTGGGARAPELVDAAVAHVAAHSQVLWLALGDRASKPLALAGVRVCAPGYVSPARFAALLGAADLFLAPYVDGVSTRRGAAMAALQHAIPVVGTDGPLTDAVLQTSAALELVPVGQPEQFADAAALLAANPAERQAIGERGRDLYCSEFDWPLIAHRLLAACEE